LCRKYEQEVIDVVYKRSALPASLSERLRAARRRLIESLREELEKVPDNTRLVTCLRFCEPCCLLSFYCEQTNLPDGFFKDSIRIPFEGALAFSKLRPKLFLTKDMQTAQVRRPLTCCTCLEDWHRLVQFGLPIDLTVEV
jgi:hypothetical protein